MLSKSILFNLFLLFIFSVTAQSSTFQNAQAISAPNGEIFYDTEGYTITLKDYELTFDEKGFKKLKRKLELPATADVLDSPDFPKVKFVRYEMESEGVHYFITHFFSVPRWQFVRVVTFITSCDRSEEIEKEFYGAILNKTLPKQIFTPVEVDTVSFAGRTLKLGSACQWRGPRSLQCPDYGQINWSEFSNVERAKQIIVNQKIENLNHPTFRLAEEKEIQIIFEGQEVQATRRKLINKIPSAAMGGSNTLIVYYVTAEVRGRFVSCVLSHYTNDVNADIGLPPLLAELMQLKP